MTWHAVPAFPGLELELSARWDGTNWTDLPIGDLRGFATSYSYSNESHVWPPGSGTFALGNRTGDYTPGNLGSKWAPNVREGTHVRLRGRVNGTDEYDIWYGLLEQFEDKFAAGGRDAVETYTTVQPSALLAAYKIAPGEAVGADERTRDRIGRILALVGWSGLGLETLTSYDDTPLLASDMSGDALSAIGKAAEADGGNAFCWYDGFVYYPRNWLFVASTAKTPQAVFDRDHVPYVDDVTFGRGLDIIVSQSIGQRVDGTPITYTLQGGVWGAAKWSTDTWSGAVTVYGRSFLNLQTGSDSTVSAVLKMTLYTRRDAYLYPKRIKIRPKRTGAWGDVLARQPYDRVTVSVPTPWGDTETTDCFIVGIHHEVVAGDWITSFDLMPATAYDFTPGLWSYTDNWGTAKWGF